MDAGVGPVGAAVAARFLVMLAGDAGGESLVEVWGTASLSVCLREGDGRTAALDEEGAVARDGEAGGVCV